MVPSVRPTRHQHCVPPSDAPAPARVLQRLVGDRDRGAGGRHLEREAGQRRQREDHQPVDGKPRLPKHQGHVECLAEVMHPMRCPADAGVMAHPVVQVRHRVHDHEADDERELAGTRCHTCTKDGGASAPSDDHSSATIHAKGGASTSATEIVTRSETTRARGSGSRCSPVAARSTTTATRMTR